MTNSAYRAYCERRVKADKLKKSICDIYCANIHTSYIKAVKDGLLNKEERELIREFYDVNSNKK